MIKLIQPLHDYVVLKHKKENEIIKSKSGIILELNKSEIGIVVSCGPQVSDENIKPNSKVIYKNYEGQKIKLEEEYLIIKSKDIIAVLV